MKNVGKTIKDYSLYLGVFFLALGFTSCSDDDDGDVLEPDPTGSITVEDQTVTNNTITVSNVQADEDAWLVVRRGTQTGEQLADPVYITEGTRSDVNITLDQDVALVDGETLVLVLHEDDGDSIFDEITDIPFTDDDGNVSETFTVSLDDTGEPGEDAAVQYYVGDQTISQNTIHIDSIRVEEDSWLVARNAGSEDAPEVVSDTVQLMAGLNENVVLTLNQDANLSGTEEGDDVTLMVHQDDGVEGEYEYDGESGVDEPITDAESGEAISQTVNVTAPNLSAEDEQVVTENNEVTFTSVNAAQDSWIVLYIEDDNGDIDYDNPVGATRVEAGTQEEVTVPFNDTYTPTAGDTIYPRLHVDSPNDEEFTYTVGGTDDLPETYGFDETTGEGVQVDNSATETGGFTIQLE